MTNKQQTDDRVTWWVSACSIWEVADMKLKPPYFAGLVIQLFIQMWEAEMLLKAWLSIERNRHQNNAFMRYQSSENYNACMHGSRDIASRKVKQTDTESEIIPLNNKTMCHILHVPCLHPLQWLGLEFLILKDEKEHKQLEVKIQSTDWRE